MGNEFLLQKYKLAALEDYWTLPGQVPVLDPEHTQEALKGQAVPGWSLAPLQCTRQPIF